MLPYESIMRSVELARATIETARATIPVIPTDLAVAAARIQADRVAIMAVERAASFDLARLVRAPQPSPLDPFLALDDAADGDAEALTALTDWLGVWPVAPQARRQLRRIAAEQGPEAVTMLKQEAVVLAVGRRWTPQRIRLGRRDWVGTAGQRVPVVPEELPVQWERRWLRQAAVNELEAILLDEAEPTGCGDQLAVHGDPAPAPEEVALQREALAEVLAAATPRQLAIVEALAAGYTTAEIAAGLGIQPATVWVQVHRLRKRVERSPAL